MRTIAIAILLITSAASSAEPRVSYTLHTYAPGTSTPIEMVKAGSEFDLALVVQDTRPEIDGMFRGVFASYVNCNYAKRYAALQHVQYTSPYLNGKNCGQVDNGLAEWGAFRGLGKGDTEPAEISRVRFKALWPIGVVGNEVTASFRPQFANIRKPRFDTLLYGTLKRGGGYYPGEQSFVLPDEIRATGTTVRIVK
jgi:hypothetical protein